MTVETLPPPIEPRRSERVATRILQMGAVAVVLAVAVLHVFELDRFFVPKELVLHVAAFVAGLLVLRQIRNLAFTRVDLLLMLFLALSAASAVFATNRWLAFRALALSASSIALFWIGRALRDSALRHRLIGAAGFAVVLAAITSLAQTYGLELDVFSENRVPGGTLGNRNFVAHAAAFGWPLLVLMTLRARSGGGVMRNALGAAIVTGTLVLTRSRGAWLAFAVAAILVLIAILCCRPLRGEVRTWNRLTVIVLFAGLAVAAALLLPNSLNWRSDNPYLESVKNVADYSEGSGRGRLVQYERTLRMAASRPILGVGPGNWPVAYPAAVPPSDPSLDDSEPGMTSNPWPSSDWIAFIAERGFLAATLLFTACFMIFIDGVRQIFRAEDGQTGAEGVALIGMTSAAAVAGAFDAVLLLALPAFLVWLATGALWQPDAGNAAQSLQPVKRRVSRLLFVAVLFLAAAGAVRSGTQLGVMQIYATTSDRASLEQAAKIDPGNYRLQLRLARIALRKNRCTHARAAHALFPQAQAAAAASRGCR